MSLIRHTFTLVRPVFGAVAIFTLAFSFMSGAIQTAFAVDNEQKVTICHATGNESYQSVPASMTADAGGHYGQDHQDGMDIIPEFDYPAQGNDSAGHFDGQNWNAEGQAIWNNDCEPVPDPVVGCMDDSYDNYDPLATEDTEPSSCANENVDEDKCEVEGHKYTLDSERKAVPLSDWVIGLMKIRTYEDESSNTFDLAYDITDKDGYYCLEWDGESGLPEGEETTPYKSFVYYVYEVLVAGWTNIIIEKGIDVPSLAPVPDTEIFETPIDRVSTQVFEKNGYLPADTAYHVDFYNKKDGDDTNSSRYTLSVAITGDGEGSVTDEGEGNGITCLSTTPEGQEISNDCSETYPAGTEVTLVATPDEGSNFNNSWTVGAGSCTGNTTPCTVTMNSNLSLTAHFDLNSSNSGGGGGGGGGGSSSGSHKKHSSGGSSSNEPTGEVLGESTSVLPVGAPNTGAGGTSSSPIASFVALFGMLMSLVTLRVTKNG